VRIAFFSNYLNHHQLPFCIEMVKLLEGDFTFIACDEIPDFRMKLGYEDMNSKYDFVLKTYENEENEKKAMKLADECDFIIFGAAPVKYIRLREKAGKPSFIYSERLFKPNENKLMIKTYLAYLKSYLFRKKNNVYILCASQYTSNDFRMIGAYWGRYYQWGYFPRDYTYDIAALMQRKRAQSKPVILWAGRIIPYKNPGIAVKTADYLSQNGIDFEMRIIGDGEIRQETETMIHAYGLEDKVHLMGSMPPDSVRRNMEEASVFLFTSDYSEGWGAVLNESMNSGCAVVVSHAVGSAGFLVKNGVNGIIYPFGDQEAVNYWTKLLICDNSFREKLGKNAYRTIHESWNARQSAVRILALCDRIRNHQSSDFYTSGPCSPAEHYGNHQYRKRVQSDLSKMKKQYEDDHGNKE